MPATLKARQLTLEKLAAYALITGMTPAPEWSYGPKQKPVSIAVNKVVFEKMLKEAGESTVINLVGIGEEVEVLIHDVAFNALKGGVDHVDFYVLEKGKAIELARFPCSNLVFHTVDLGRQTQQLRIEFGRRVEQGG